MRCHSFRWPTTFTCTSVIGLRRPVPGSNAALRGPTFTFETATAADVNELVALHTAVAVELTRRYGSGPWSATTSERGMLFGLRTTRVFVARQGAKILATFRLTHKKPWAIDTRYFTPSQNSIYLLAMAVTPG